MVKAFALKKLHDFVDKLYQSYKAWAYFVAVKTLRPWLAGSGGVRHREERFFFDAHRTVVFQVDTMLQCMKAARRRTPPLPPSVPRPTTEGAGKGRGGGAAAARGTAPV